jgi:uncharacterized protein YfaS (alpha-2-macroglobulin family)
LGTSNKSNFKPVPLTNSIDLKAYLDFYNANLAQTISPGASQFEAHISTDKVIYRPGDTMFIEVYVVDGFTKAPLLYQNGVGTVYASMTILDPTDSSVYSTSGFSTNSTISFTYVIPENQATGQFKVVIQGSNMADSIRIFRIRQY